MQSKGDVNNKMKGFYFENKNSLIAKTSFFKID